MANKDEYVSAAKVPPSQRTSRDEQLVRQGSNMQEVRNADHEARRQESANGR